MANQYYLGVDAGGTSTKACLIDAHSHELASSLAGPGNYRTSGIEIAISNIMQSVLNTIGKTKIQPQEVSGICVGAASIDTLRDYDEVYEIIEKELRARGFTCPIKLVNDAVVAMRGATSNKNAILIIMGTGANCYGTNSDKQEVWVSGLDYVLSDEAGGYALGLGVLRAAVRSADGRDSKTLLELLVKKELSIQNMRDAKDVLHDQKFGKKEIAGFARYAFQAHEQGDLTATKLIHKILEEGMIMIHAAHKRLSLNGKPFDIVLVGGLTHERIMQSLLTTQINKEYPQAKIIFPQQKAAKGAALLAKEL